MSDKVSSTVRRGNIQRRRKGNEERCNEEEPGGYVGGSGESKELPRHSYA